MESHIHTEGRGTVAQTGSGSITTWEHDPGNRDRPDGGEVLHRDVPITDVPPFATRITAAASLPPADSYLPGTAGFRYWACADALRRASNYWGGLLGNHHWHADIADNVLPVKLDAGVELNAYYDRAALHFFHATVADRVVYTGESPDVVCHELGHAVLDAIRPQLWDVASFEPTAFHEAFGDMSAILSALQVPSIRIAVLAETNNEIHRSSRLSRLAEQLGWAIRQQWPEQVDGDCLRNAVSSLSYEDPDHLPISAPARALSSEPHSFSRVFTAAFMDSLGLMFAAAGEVSEAALQQVSVDLGHIVVKAIQLSPVVPEYFAQIAGHMIALATAKSASYGRAVETAMAKHGIIAAPVAAAGAAAVLGGGPGLEAAPGGTTESATEGLVLDACELDGGALPLEELDVTECGLAVSKVDMVMAGQPKRFGVASAGAGPDASCARHCAVGYFEDLLRRGRVELGPLGPSRLAIAAPAPPGPFALKTHQLVIEAGRVVLRRIRIDCGIAKPAAPGR